MFTNGFVAVFLDESVTAVVRGAFLNFDNEYKNSAQ